MQWRSGSAVTLVLATVSLTSLAVSPHTGPAPGPGDCSLVVEDQLYSVQCAVVRVEQCRTDRRVEPRPARQTRCVPAFSSRCRTLTRTSPATQCRTAYTAECSLQPSTVSRYILCIASKLPV